MLTEERLMELEIKLSYQEDLLQELNSIVASQQKQISQLEGTLLLLYERMKSISVEDGTNQTDNQPPPHY